MQNGILLLPFLGLFSLVLGVASSKAYKDMPGVGVVFFALAGILFLFWLFKDKRSIGDLFRRKGAKHGLSQGLSVILALLVALGLGFLTQKDRFNRKIDLTRDSLNTLSAESIKLIEQTQSLAAPIKILAFFQTEEKKAEFRRMIGLYQSKGLNSEIEYIDPETDPTRAIAENITMGDTVLLKGQKQEARLTAFTEEKITNSILRVLKEKERKIYFLTGHGEADLGNQEPAGYSTAKAELESERFVVESINLLETGKIPDDADLLVIAGPKYDLQEVEVELLKQYIQSARPLMALVDALVQVPRLNEILAEAGIRLNDDLVIIRPDLPQAKLLGQNNAIITDFDKLSPVTAEFVRRGSVALKTPNTRTLEVNPQNSLNLKVVGLAKNSEMSVRITNVKTESDLKGGISPERLSGGRFDIFAVASGSVGGSKVAAIEKPETMTETDIKSVNQAGASKELRVFVGGSSHLASNIGATRAENVDFFINAINYLLQDEDFISVRAKELTKSQLNLTSNTSQFLLWSLTWVYPFLFLGAGSYYWLKRRRA